MSIYEYNEEYVKRTLFEDGVEAGYDKGRAAGFLEGELKGLIKQICKKLAKDKTPEEIADDLEEELDVIIPICEIALQFAPEYNCEKIYESFRTHFPDYQPASCET